MLNTNNRDRKESMERKNRGGNFGHRLVLLFKHGSITLSYLLLSVVIFFYLIVNYKATNIFFTILITKKYGLLKSLISTTTTIIYLVKH
jgi:hypothetical protein